MVKAKQCIMIRALLFENALNRPTLPKKMRVMNKLEKTNKNDDEIFKEQIDQNIMIITIHFKRKQLENKSHKSFISEKLQALVDSQ